MSSAEAAMAAAVAEAMLARAEGEEAFELVEAEAEVSARRLPVAVRPCGHQR
jgi:hypothetical protein